MKNGTKKVKANTFLNLAKRKKEKSTSNQIIFFKTQAGSNKQTKKGLCLIKVLKNEDK